MWPKQDAQSLSEFYGQPWKIDSSGVVLDPTFEKSHIIRIKAPYDMWMGDIKITKIAVNKKCAESLGIILENIGRKITAADRKHYQLDQYGGCFNFRPMRRVGGRLTINKLSVHAYGAAIDLAPALNPLGKYYEPNKRMMPPEVIGMFRNEGAVWGGDFKTCPDCMHFQFSN